MKLLTAPKSLENIESRRSLFLAGSIEQGVAVDWQAKVTKSFSDYSDKSLTILNPRRKNWDASWEQSINNKEFKEQVTWELDALGLTSVILIHFVGDTKSPLSLLELGMFAASRKVIVSCEPNFWRRGNIEVVCDRFEVPLVDNLDSAIELIKLRIGNA